MHSLEEIYRHKKVLITGHTGFKGSWLALWLQKLGATVVGYALEPETTPNHFDLLDLDMESVIGDIRDLKTLQHTFDTHQPDIVFHLAAQPLVRRSYRQPVETFDVNIMGTVNVLETSRHTPSVKAVIIITSDKCYENREWVWGYRENDPMGGYDPYSASKGAAELIVSSYRNSFFNRTDYGKTHHTLVASCRAGNVIGGGDWSEDRLIPDIVRAIEADRAVEIRSPHATRPWQHVLDALHGYLMVGKKLLQGESEFADAWNFGPPIEESMQVEEICRLTQKIWNAFEYTINPETSSVHEAHLLSLDCSKAHKVLGWKNKFSAQEAIDKTMVWYKHFYTTKETISLSQINEWIDQ